ELTAGCPQDVLPRSLRLSVENCRYVLQLIAESERASGLVRCRPSPDSAAQALIEKPAVDQKVRRELGGVRLQGTQQVVPPRVRQPERGLNHDRIPVGENEPV